MVLSLICTVPGSYCDTVDLCCPCLDKAVPMISKSITCNPISQSSKDTNLSFPVNMITHRVQYDFQTADNEMGLGN